jgi:hypothetical protein
MQISTPLPRRQTKTSLRWASPCLFAGTVLFATALLARSASAEPPAGYTLAWHDEFDHLSVGGPKSGATWMPYFVRWGVRNLSGNQDKAAKTADSELTAKGNPVGDLLQQAGLGNKQNGILDSVSDGALQMRAFKLPQHLTADFWNLPYVAAMVSAEHGFSQKYGYWEVRLRLDNVSRGDHFAAWLLPTDGSWPPEIDMLEAVGQNPESIFTNGIGRDSNLPLTRVPIDGSPHDWMTIGFLWTPKTMRWTLNGRTVREQENFIHDRSLYFLMTWEVGGQWTGPPTDATTWPAQVSVDYVRIYKGPDHH